MKRLSIPLATLAITLLAFAGSHQQAVLAAGTAGIPQAPEAVRNQVTLTVTYLPFVSDRFFNPCTAEKIRTSGKIRNDETITDNAKKRIDLSVSTYENAKGTGLTSGDKYQFEGSTTSKYVTDKPTNTVTYTSEGSLRVTSPHQPTYLYVIDQQEVTVNGVVTSFVDYSGPTCLPAH